MADGEIYLGDDVYLQYLADGDLAIYLSNGVHKTSFIYLDEDVRRVLLRHLIACSEGDHGKT